MPSLSRTCVPDLLHLCKQSPAHHACPTRAFLSYCTCAHKYVHTLPVPHMHFPDMLHLCKQAHAHHACPAHDSLAPAPSQSSSHPRAAVGCVLPLCPGQAVLEWEPRGPGVLQAAPSIQPLSQANDCQHEAAAAQGKKMTP